MDLTTPTQTESIPFPTLDPSSATEGQDILVDETIKQGADLYLKNGCLLVKNAFPTEFVSRLYNAYADEYKDYFHDKNYKDVLNVGNKRNQITVEIKGVFNTPQLYANPQVFSLAKYLLGNEVILGSFGSVTSLPGAEEQHVHRDLPHIYDYPYIRPDDEKVLPVLPPYAISILVPLVPFNETNGTTRMWLGSHLVTKDQTQNCLAVEPKAEPGDCLFMDYRLLHGGTANTSDNIRPMFYFAYSRPWFRDFHNYRKHDPVVISDQEYAKIPKPYKQLFGWTRQGSRAYFDSAPSLWQRAKGKISWILKT